MRDWNEGCGLETHTARGAAECCMGLEITTRVPESRIERHKRTLCVELGPAAV